jgi:hypothetical protein
MIAKVYIGDIYGEKNSCDKSSIVCTSAIDMVVVY